VIVDCCCCCLLASTTPPALHLRVPPHQLQRRVALLQPMLSNSLRLQGRAAPAHTVQQPAPTLQGAGAAPARPTHLHLRVASHQLQRRVVLLQPILSNSLHLPYKGLEQHQLAPPTCISALRRISSSAASCCSSPYCPTACTHLTRGWSSTSLPHPPASPHCAASAPAPHRAAPAGCAAPPGRRWCGPARPSGAAAGRRWSPRRRRAASAPGGPARGHVCMSGMCACVYGRVCVWLRVSVWGGDLQVQQVHGGVQQSTAPSNAPSVCTPALKPDTRPGPS